MTLRVPHATRIGRNKTLAGGVAPVRFIGPVDSLCRLVAFLLLIGSATTACAQVDEITTTKAADGWRLQVNGEAFYVKGVVWSYTPKGRNFEFDLFDESDDFVQAVLDYDFGLMKAAGINAIRSFMTIPPRWVEYIYREHGIMTVINPLMGRYGATVDGEWVQFVDYSDRSTAEALRRDALDTVRRYRDTPGVLMFAFGNESNYGLSWSSFEIEDLPIGEQEAARARYLYELFEEVISDGKRIAPGHLFTIVNGDIQYIDLIAELVPSLDVLGSNVYRGPGFTDLWERVEARLDLPVVFFEFGSDAFNAQEQREDQLAQAEVLKSQWREMYGNAAGNGGIGNSIGGFVFEWRDEWWKHLQTERLDIQDTHASWLNEGYLFDWAPGDNNMNEEWFGVTALGAPNAEGVETVRPRRAYDVLAEVFALDPYEASREQIDAGFSAIDATLSKAGEDVREP